MMSPKKNTADVFDITFVGAGPTGLFGAFYAGLREMQVKITMLYLNPAVS